MKMTIADLVSAHVARAENELKDLERIRLARMTREELLEELLEARDVQAQLKYERVAASCDAAALCKEFGYRYEELREVCHAANNIFEEIIDYVDELVKDLPMGADIIALRMKHNVVGTQKQIDKLLTKCEGTRHYWNKKVGD